MVQMQVMNTFLIIFIIRGSAAAVNGVGVELILLLGITQAGASHR